MCKTMSSVLGRLFHALASVVQHERGADLSSEAGPKKVGIRIDATLVVFFVFFTSSPCQLSLRKLGL